MFISEYGFISPWTYFPDAFPCLSLFLWLFLAPLLVTFRLPYPFPPPLAKANVAQRQQDRKTTAIQSKIIRVFDIFSSYLFNT